MINETIISGLLNMVKTVFVWLNTHYLISYKGFQLSFLAADFGLICCYLILKLVLGNIFTDEEGDDDI